MRALGWLLYVLALVGLFALVLHSPDFLGSERLH